MQAIKPIKELIIIIVTTIAIVGLYAVVNSLFDKSLLDINMHDTFYVNKPSWAVIALVRFLQLFTFIYFIRNIIYKFRHTTQNLILFISCACLNVLTLYRLEQDAMLTGFEHALTRSNTLYPPLSVSGNHLQETNPTPLFGRLQILFVVQIALILLLSIIAALTAKNWNTNKNAL